MKYFIIGLFVVLPLITFCKKVDIKNEANKLEKLRNYVENVEFKTINPQDRVYILPNPDPDITNIINELSGSTNKKYLSYLALVFVRMQILYMKEFHQSYEIDISNVIAKTFIDNTSLKNENCELWLNSVFILWIKNNYNLLQYYELLDHKLKELHFIENDLNKQYKKRKKIAL
jgi:hypothetical protein